MKSGQGKTNRAALDNALTGDPKKSVTQIITKLGGSVGMLEGYITNYLNAKNEKDDTTEIEKQVSLTHGVVIASLQDLNTSWMRAKQAVGDAKKRIPKSLAEDKEVEQAFAEMNAALVKVEKKELAGIKQKIAGTLSKMKNSGLLS